MQKLESAKVLVVGDVMLDKYWHGNTKRISPEAPVPVVHINEAKYILGGAANVANNIAALGGESHLAGFCGNDESGLQLRNILKEANIEAHLVGLNLPTITKLRVLSQHQQLIRLDFEDSFKSVDASPLLDSIREQLHNVNAVIFSDYNKGTLEQVSDMIALTNHADIPVIVDPKGNDFNRYKGAYLLTPNFSEFLEVVGPCENDEEIIFKAKALLSEIDVKNILITRGADGMTLVQENGEVHHQATKAQEVFDVTGAGDTVIGVLGMSVGAGYDLKTAMMFANTAAGIVVGKVGTATLSIQELNKALHQTQAIPYGVVDRETAKIACQQAQLQGDKVVFTNGCFDILHTGHVEYLQTAREQGDCLIVAVNDDDSIKRLKGESRPILPFEERMILLASLECVDWVVGFHEDTPIPLLELLKPDVLVKGGDYCETEIVGHEIVKAYGGSVKPLQLIPGRSTTTIIEKIQSGS